jgi:hypothetical protein
VPSIKAAFKPMAKDRNFPGTAQIRKRLTEILSDAFWRILGMAFL